MDNVSEQPPISMDSIALPRVKLLVSLSTFVTSKILHNRIIVGLLIDVDRFRMTRR